MSYAFNTSVFIFYKKWHLYNNISQFEFKKDENAYFRNKYLNKSCKNRLHYIKYLKKQNDLFVKLWNLITMEDFQNDINSNKMCTHFKPYNNS